MTMTTNGVQDQQQSRQQQLKSPTSKSPATFPPPSYKDVIRYRYHHGTNLGSIFVLERWLTPGMFHSDTKGSSELAAVEGWVAQEGMESARKRFEQHWKTYVSDDDLDWLRDVARCTTVRVPIGYFTLGLAFCEHTPFRAVAGVYRNAWTALEALIRRCYARGIGVLIDLHALPGGANAQEHSGTNSGKAEFWRSRSYRDLAIKGLRFVAERAHVIKGVAGIQIVNESEWDAKGMYEWYDKVVFELSRIDPGIPIYISDAWDLDRAVKWSQEINRVEKIRSNPVVVDTHLYWCFNEGDIRKTPQQVTEDAGRRLAELDGRAGGVVDRGAAQVIVGEYSCVLADSSWAKAGKPKEELVGAFGRAQSRRYMQRAGGCFFWTYRMDWMPGGEWGFRQMTEQSAIFPPASLTLTAADVQARVQQTGYKLQELKQRSVSAHCNYWNSKLPGKHDSRHFEQGWDLGFDDAQAFFAMRSRNDLQGADTIGMLDIWCRKRLQECGYESRSDWEFEHGLRKGIQDFVDCAMEERC